jgi:hypothetical protein
MLMTAEPACVLCVQCFSFTMQRRRRHCLPKPKPQTLSQNTVWPRARIPCVCVSGFT